MTDNLSWRQNLIADTAGIKTILEQAKRIAVIGIKNDPNAPAYYVPSYMHQHGYEIVPVSPNVEQVFGIKAYSRLEEVPGEIDIVQIFRRPEFVHGHAEEALAKRPVVFWTQSGIVDWEVAERLARSGIKVVMSRCMMVDHRNFMGNF